MRAVMWRQVGVQRNGHDLEQAYRTLRFWRHHQANGAFQHPLGWSLQNRLLVGSIIARAAAERSASVGTHWRSDSSGEIDQRHKVLHIPAGEEML